MGESIGQIVFINSHDYVSDVTGQEVVGCLAFMKTEDGKDVALNTKSLRLQHTLEMAYATKRKITVDYFETEVPFTEQQRLITTATGTEPAGRFEGPFNLKAMWTLE
jgi:hypothetical protein